MLQTLNLARIARPSAEPPEAAGAASGLELVEVASGDVPIGAALAGFAYDNERPRHVVALPPFRIGRVPVTNGDWLAFVEDGGYTRREWWSEDGWAWRSSERIERPLNWLDSSQEWRFGGVTPLEAARPVLHISRFEADAFARARGVRLPSEAEWEQAATWDGAAKRAWPWGEEAPGPEHANLFESGLLAPAPVGAYPDGAAPCGALGLIGDVWEWTASEFDGYPGFVAHPYREYSEVFFRAG
jgi:iron(II)-dependent oxidoreductase